MISENKGAIEGGNHAALWHGRFKEGPDAQAVEFETSIHVDERMVFDDIFVNFDTNRRDAAWQTMESFAADKQLIIFECK